MRRIAVRHVGGHDAIGLALHHALAGAARQAVGHRRAGPAAVADRPHVYAIGGGGIDFADEGEVHVEVFEQRGDRFLQQGLAHEPGPGAGEGLRQFAMRPMALGEVFVRQDQAKGRGELPGELFVPGGEGTPVTLVAEVYAAEDPVLVDNGHRQQRTHGRMAGGKSGRARVGAELVHAQGRVPIHHGPEQSVAAGEPADPGGRPGVDPRVHEIDGHSRLVHQSDGGIARADQLGQQLDALLQDLAPGLRRKHPRQALRGRVEDIEVLGAHCHL